MRYLNKIIFINSAAIKYTEIAVDGNVHFIGTQGVGKSTVLRAILFFYNANTQKLGIAREKKPFSEYYLSYRNSFLIYEVHRETGPFCVVAFKSQGKACFRFFEGPYERQFFIGEDGKARDNWDHIKGQFNIHNLHYTKKIDRYEDYRDILYGNYEGKKEYRRYALLNSRQYQNIPRTIQNVFLNSKLEAEFIKQTIIMSLNEEDIGVDLQTYDHHLKGFEDQLNDIRKFRNPQVIRQTTVVSKLQKEIQLLSRTRDQLARQLAWKIKDNREKEPALTAGLSKERELKNAIIESLQQARTSFEVEEEEITKKIGVLDNLLAQAKEKARMYEQLNIQELIARVGKKSALEDQQKDLQEEHRLLSSQFAEITQKYTALTAELTNQFDQFENRKNSYKLEVQKGALSEQEIIRQQLEEKTDVLNSQHQNKLKEARRILEKEKGIVQELSVERASLTGRRYFEEEIKAQKSAIEECHFQIRQSEIEKRDLQGQIRAKQEELEMKTTTRQENFRHSKERTDEKIKGLVKKIEEIDRMLSNSKNSFYGWLNEHYPSWDDTIGKVCDEQVLFQADLNPRLSPTQTSSFYGIDLELEEIGRTVKTVADYEQEKATAALAIEQEEAGIRELSTQLEAALDKLQKSILSALKALKKSIEENNYAIEQNSKKAETAKFNLTSLEEKAEAEKIAALELVNSRIAAANGAVQTAREQLKTLEDGFEAEILAIKKLAASQIQVLKEQAREEIAIIEEELKNKKDETDGRLSEIKARQNEELSGKGADTARLNAIEKELNSIREELRFIEDKRDTVADYKKDKRELFDKADEFSQQKKAQQDLLQQKRQQYGSLKAARESEISQKQEAIDALNSAISAIEEDKQEFQTFTGTECYKSLSQLFQEERSSDSDNQTDLRGIRLIQELNRAFYEGTLKINHLKEAVTKFLGHFSVHNIFKFNTGLVEGEEFLQFARDLYDFVEEDKIAQYEKRVNTRFADIIRLIGQETTTLVSREGEIQKVISRINKDFESKNFVGAIKKIELKLEESANKVVLILKEIKSFNDENIFALGENNLFSSLNQDVNNKKAIELLRLLLEEISKLKRNAITLSDSFELKFRIVENNNDTGWVENLSNVGSEGTDVLVKAMINIMLLNVFKDWASKNAKDFRLHCMMDEIGKLHPSNVRGILKFANDRNILLINGSPTENDALAYKHIYKLAKDQNSVTKVKRILTQHSSHEVTA